MRHHHRHFSVIDAVVLSYIADRTAQRYGLGPTAVIGIGILAAWLHPLFGLAYVALLLVCWLLRRGFIALGELRLPVALVILTVAFFTLANVFNSQPQPATLATSPSP
jgi:hypothetical protein